MEHTTHDSSQKSIKYILDTVKSEVSKGELYLVERQIFPLHLCLKLLLIFKLDVTSGAILIGTAIQVGSVMIDPLHTVIEYSHGRDLCLCKNERSGDMLKL